MPAHHAGGIPLCALFGITLFLWLYAWVWWATRLTLFCTMVREARRGRPAECTPRSHHHMLAPQRCAWRCFPVKFPPVGNTHAQCLPTMPGDSSVCVIWHNAVLVALYLGVVGYASYFVLHNGPRSSTRSSSRMYAAFSPPHGGSTTVRMHAMRMAACSVVSYSLL